MHGCPYSSSMISILEWVGGLWTRFNNMVTFSICMTWFPMIYVSEIYTEVNTERHIIISIGLHLHYIPYIFFHRLDA